MKNGSLLAEEFTSHRHPGFSVCTQRWTYLQTAVPSDHLMSILSPQPGMSLLSSALSVPIHPSRFISTTTAFLGRLVILPCSFQCSLHLALVNVNRSLMVSSARLEPDARFSVAIHDKLKPASHLSTAEHLNASTPLSIVSHFCLNQAVPCFPQLLHWSSDTVTHILPCKAWAPGLLQHWSIFSAGPISSCFLGSERPPFHIAFHKSFPDSARPPWFPGQTPCVSLQP